MKEVPLYDERPRAPVELFGQFSLGVSSACTLCELSQQKLYSPCIKAEGEPGGLFVVGESPGRNEDYAGRPFIGASGKLLRDMLSRHWKGPVAIDNAVRCKPGSGSGKGKKKLDKKHFDACRAYLARTLQQVKPERVVLLGGWSAYSFLGRNVPPMSTRRSYTFISMGGRLTPVFMVLHPAFALRNRFIRELFEGDLEWALTETNLPDLPLKGRVRVIETVDDSRQAIAALRASEWGAFDVEASGSMYTPDYRLLCLSFVQPGSDSPFYWNEQSLLDEQVRRPLFDYLEDPRARFGGQNVKYDQLAMRTTFGLDVQGLMCDVRLARKLIQPEADADLDTMSELVGMGGMKEDADATMRAIDADIRRTMREYERSQDPTAKMSQKRRDAAPEAYNRLDPYTVRCIEKGYTMKKYGYAILPERVLCQYNARDTVSTGRLVTQQLGELQGEPELTSTWNGIILPAASALERVEDWGIEVDASSVRLFDQHLAAQEKTVVQRLSVYPNVDWNSPQQVANLFFETLGLKPVKETSGGALSTDVEVLEKLRGQHPIVDALADFRSVTKLRGTYAQGMLPHIKSGRIHPNIKLDGARSGRTSCIAGWCIVRTRRGGVRMSEVVVGDEVWTHRHRWRRVTRTLDRGVRPVVSLRLSNGSVLTSTTDHKLLSSRGTWKEAIEYAGEQSLGIGEQGRGVGALPSEGESDDASDSGTSWNARGERYGGAPNAHEAGGIPSAEVDKVLGEQARRPQPDEREDGREAPQLEGSLRGRAWLPNDHLERSAEVRSRRRDDEGAGGYRATDVGGRSPYRRRPDEQRSREPSVDDEWRSSADTLLAGEGQCGVICEEVQASGSAPVYDLTVEDDESFLVEGVFAHNCTDPNLQNIPRAQTPEGKMARDCFIAPPGKLLFELDYSQLELRVVAMLSGDKVMRQIFIDGHDLHRRTAEMIAQLAWGISSNAVTDQHRSWAKSVNFGVLYGKTARSLAKEWGVSVAKAQTVVDAILGKFTDLRDWMSEQRSFVKKHGYSWTWWDGGRARRRPLYDVASSDGFKRSTAENGAVNTPVQGTASDFCVRSLAECVDWIVGDGLEDEVKLVLTVHDSLMFEAPEDMADEVIGTVTDIMMSWNSLGVPLKVDCKTGRAWGSLKEVA